MLFDIRVKQEIIVSPMCKYIENWLKLDLIKITEEDQMETVGTSHENSTKENIRAKFPTK